MPSPDSASFIVTATSQEPEQQQAVFEVIEGGRQADSIPEDKEDSEERTMEVMEATKAASVSSEATAGGDNGVVFGNGGLEDMDLNGGGGGADDFILKTPAAADNDGAPVGQLDELIQPEPVIQKATVDLLYDNEEPKRPEDVVNDLLSGGGDDLLLDAKNSGLHDQKEEGDQFGVKNDQFEVNNDQFEVKDGTLNVEDDPFKIGTQPVDVKEVPLEVKDEPSEVKDAPFEVKEESSEVKADPFEEPSEVNAVPREVQNDVIEDKIDPLAEFSAPEEVKQGCYISNVVTCFKASCYMWNDERFHLNPHQLFASKISNITASQHCFIHPLQEPFVIEQEREEFEQEPVQTQEEAPSHEEKKEPELAQQEPIMAQDEPVQVEQSVN